MSIFPVLSAMCLHIVTGVAFNPTLEEKQRIVGGVETVEGEIPFQILLKFENWERCGGSLIQIGSVQAAVTAAHCLHSSDTASYTIVAGEHQINAPSGNEQTRSISKISIHPEYNPRRHTNDIAILKPREPFVLNEFVSPIRLPKEDEQVPEIGLVSGWGSTEPWRDANILRKASVKIVNNTICKLNYQDSGLQIEDSMVCAGEDGIDSCQGDSGGPLAADVGTDDFYLLGVVSFGIGCGRPTHPGVYTRVSAFIPWIIEEVGVDVNI